MRESIYTAIQMLTSFMTCCVAGVISLSYCSSLLNVSTFNYSSSMDATASKKELVTLPNDSIAWIEGEMRVVKRLIGVFDRGATSHIRQANATRDISSTLLAVLSRLSLEGVLSRGAYKLNAVESGDISTKKCPPCH